MPEQDDRATEHALRSTSDTMLDDLEQLIRLEREKRLLGPDDPRREAIADRVATLAQRVLSGATQEAMLTAEAASEVATGSPDAPVRSIEETAPRSLHDILSEWRDAERRGAAVEPGTDAATRIAEEISRLRFEYRRAYERASGSERD